MGLDKDRAVRIAVTLAAGGDQYRLGSGYLIADGLVLTAAHVLALRDGEAPLQGQPAEVKRACGDWQAAIAVWLDAARDVAVLSCPDMRADGGVRWGRLTGSEPVAWGAVGFPAASADDSAGYQSEHAWGQTSPISESGAGRLALTVESREAIGGGSPWAGLSGAAVFCGDHLVGVVTTDPGRYAKSLVGRRVEDFCHDAGLIQLLDGRLALEDVIGPDVRPSRDTRQRARAVRIPPRPKFLAGRGDLLADLEARLYGDGTGPRVVTLCGLGGAGKTSVAVEFAHRQAARLDVVWVFDAEEPTALAAGFGKLTAQLGVDDRHDAGDPVATAHSILADYPAEWLLVFDNAPHLAAVEAVLPPVGCGLVLITSRDPDWPVGEVVDVPVLDREVAAEFLLHRADPGGTVAAQELAAARELADELGGLPLALEQAAAYMKATFRGVASYLELFRKRRTELLARGDTGVYRKQVTTTWTLAFEELQRTHPVAVSLLRLLACCAPEAIPVRLLLQPAAGLADSLGPEAAPLRQLIDDSLLADDATAALRRYSLVNSAREGTLSVHRLVQAVTLGQLPAGQAEAWRTATEALIQAALPGERHQEGDWPIYCVHADRSRLPDAWPAYAALLPHAQGALAASSDAIADIANYLRESGNYPAARDLQREVCSARTLTFGPEHPATLAARADLAEFTGHAGDPLAARHQFAELLPVMERVHGAEHPHTLITRSGRAHWTGESGDPAAARDQFAGLLPVMEAVLGAELPATLYARSNLGEYGGQAGNAAEALGQYTATVPAFQRILGTEHPATLGNQANLARWTGENGDAAAARDQYAGLLPAFKRILGAEHPLTLTVRAELARWTGEAQDWDNFWAEDDDEPADAAAARDQYAELLPAIERAFGPEHAQVLYVRFHLARWTGEAGDAAAARDQYTALLTAYICVFGEENPQTLITRAVLARWTGEAGDPAAARDRYAVLLPALIGTLGGEHNETQAARRGLQRWAGRAGNTAAARDCYARLLPVYDRLSGPDQPETLVIRACLASCTGEAGDPAAARDQYAEITGIYERLHGPDSPLAVGTRSAVARWTGEAGDLAAARDQFAEITGIYERLHGPESISAVLARIDLARWTAKAGDPAAARDLFAAIAAIQERQYGAESFLTLSTRSELATWTGQAGDPAAAHDQYLEIADINERLQGPESLRTLNARSELAHWTGQAGDPAAARDQYAILVPIFERVAPASDGTVIARAAMAYYAGLAEDWATAHELYAELLPVRERKHGLLHENTLINRGNLAYCTGKAGDPAAARDEFALLLPIWEREYGPEHTETRRCRANLAEFSEQASRAQPAP